MNPSLTTHPRPVRRAALAAAVAALAFLAAPRAHASTVLTFDVAGGVTNFQAVPQDYGDAVAGSPQAGHAYGFVADGLGFTPNVTAEYGTPGELPALWTTGYGDLTGVYFNDQDSDTTLTLTFTADPGFAAVLFGFDLASFSSGGQTIPGLSVTDGLGAVLFSQGSTFVAGAASGGHTAVSFGPDGLAGRTVSLVIDLTGLAMQSDNVSIDNVVFGQVVPEPARALLLGAGLLVLVAWARRS